jgi:cytochrome c553
MHAQGYPPAFSTSSFVHPSGNGALLTAGGEAAIYNQYVRTGVLTGTQASSYSSLVPFEEGTDVRATLASHATSDGSAKGGPVTGRENTMCLSCHRAHATGWDHALRWNMPPSGLLTFGGSWPGTDATGAARLPANAQGRTQAETRAAMYDRNASSFADYQKTLCNKCHAKD